MTGHGSIAKRLGLITPKVESKSPTSSKDTIRGYCPHCKHPIKVVLERE